MEIFQVKNSNALERTLFTGTVILGLVCAWVFRQTIIFRWDLILGPWRCRSPGWLVRSGKCRLESAIPLPFGRGDAHSSSACWREFQALPEDYSVYRPPR